MCGYQQEVQEEFLGTETTLRRSSLNNAPWIKTVSLTNPQSTSAYGSLDQGEASVLALAKEHDAHLVIIDEKKAREEAKRIELPVKGTVGVLLEAKKKGLIDAIGRLPDDYSVCRISNIKMSTRPNTLQSPKIYNN